MSKGRRIGGALVGRGGGAALFAIAAVMLGCGDDSSDGKPGPQGEGGSGGRRTGDAGAAGIGVAGSSRGGESAGGGSTGGATPGAGRGGGAGAGGGSSSSPGGRGATSAEGGSLPLGGTDGSGEGGTSDGGTGGSGNSTCPVLLDGEQPSCHGLSANCGAKDDASCCDSKLVQGGEFDRINDARYPATVSDFRLDTYEVTLGRFENFIACYPDNLPEAGRGRNPNDPSDSGWDEAWNSLMPADAGALEKAVACGQNQSFGKSDDRLPMNCIDWYTAAAFCIWDGGRLPTEAEWNYAAAGGSQQRVYPWSDPPTDTTFDADHAVTTFPLLPVGSKSELGDGRWGHADVAGSVREWVLDYGYSLLVYPVPCDDCANFVASENGRGNRGGGASDPATYARTTTASSFQAGVRTTALGVRCARAP